MKSKPQFEGEEVPEVYSPREEEEYSVTRREVTYPYLVLNSLKLPRYKMEVLASMVKPAENRRKPIRVLAPIGGELKDIGSLFGNQLQHLVDLLGRETVAEAWFDKETLLEGDLLYVLSSQD